MSLGSGERFSVQLTNSLQVVEAWAGFVSGAATSSELAVKIDHGAGQREVGDPRRIGRGGWHAPAVLCPTPMCRAARLWADKPATSAVVRASTNGVPSERQNREDTEMVIALFEFRLRADIDVAEWEQTFERMVALSSEAPGFISLDDYASPDGMRLAVVRFESEEALQAWKDHPEHVRAQGRGRDVFFDEYKVTVASSVIREYESQRTEDVAHSSGL
jgi:heme-degrading monooxygenase HmoA